MFKYILGIPIEFFQLEMQRCCGAIYDGNDGSDAETWKRAEAGWICRFP